MHQNLSVVNFNNDHKFFVQDLWQCGDFRLSTCFDLSNGTVPNIAEICLLSLHLGPLIMPSFL